MGRCKVSLTIHQISGGIFIIVLSFTAFLLLLLINEFLFCSEVDDADRSRCHERLTARQSRNFVT